MRRFLSIIAFTQLLLAAAASDKLTDNLSTGFIAQPLDGRYWAMASSYRASFDGDGIELIRHSRRANILFPGAKIHWEAEGDASTQIHFLGARSFTAAASLRARQALPGVDIVIRLRNGRLKSEFQLAPGVPASVAEYCLDGVQIQPDAQGQSLHLDAGSGWEWDEAGLESWQISPEGTRIPIPTRFQVDGQCVRFRTTGVNPALPLIIDPELAFSTYLGGGLFDAVNAIATDVQGNLYIGGWTESSDFPALSGYQGSSNGRIDGFVAKIGPTGQLLFSTYLGGADEDRVTALTVNGAGVITVAGYTNSLNFPTLSPARGALSGGRDAFITRIQAAGNQLVFSTYWGGQGNDAALAITQDSSGNLIVGGETTSTDFPTQAAYIATPGGGVDGFIARFAATGTLLSSTYFGGGSDDRVRSIAVTSNGLIHVTGSTSSSNFPVLNAPYPSLRGSMDAFYTAFSNTVNAFAWSTYLGGSGGSALSEEAGYGITVDSLGRIWIAGVTPSTDFPGVANGNQRTYGGGASDAFVTLFTFGSAVTWSTYIGGSGIDAATSIAAGSGFVGLSGYTTSSDLPVTNALQSARAGEYDAFWAAFPVASITPLNISYFGGAGSDSALATAASGGVMAIGGSTLSSNFPLQSAVQSNNPGSFGGFASRFRFGPSPITASPASGSGLSGTFTISIAHATGHAAINSAAVIFNTTSVFSNGCYIYYDRGTNVVSLYKDAGALWLTMTPGAATTIDNGVCTVSGAGLTVTTTANNLILTLPVTFAATFSGSRNIYANATDTAALAAGWPQVGTWAVSAPAAPAIGTATPSTGAGASQTFSFTFTDANNATDIATASVFFNSAYSISNGCYFAYNRTANTISLFRDADSTFLPVTPGANTTVENLNCSITGAGASVTASGTTLTLTVPVAFKSTFTGNKSIYATATDAGGLIANWQQIGSWTLVTNVAPIVSGIQPASGTGASQTFTVAFTDANGYADIASAYILINTTINASGGCYLTFNRASATLYLYRESDSASLPIFPGANATVENPACLISGSGFAVTGAGNQLSLAIPVTFKPGFSSQRNTYAIVNDTTGLSSGWQQVGTWIPSTSLPPTATSVFPNSGVGASQTFTLTYSDPNGASDIAAAYFLVNSSLSTAAACYLTYTAANNSLSLYRDSDSAQLPLTPGANATVSNPQCDVAGAGLVVSTSGNQLSISVPITFKAGFIGLRNLYANATDVAGLPSGWQTIGSWTPFASQAPAIASASPPTGSGVSQTFTFTLTDVNGYTDISEVSMVWNSSNTNINGCFIKYARATNTFSLLSDSDSSQQAITPGSSASVANRNCTLSGTGLAISGNGNQLSITVPLSFKAEFTGPKTIFALAADTAGLLSGWQSMGNWVPSAPAIPEVGSVSPSGGTGLSQIFTLSLSDPNGYEDIAGASIIFNNIIDGTNSCFLFYSRAANLVYLFRDSDGSWQGLTPGTSTTVSNANCSLSGSQLAITPSGTSVTLALPLTFQSSYKGLRNIYVSVYDYGNNTSGWVTAGTWTPSFINAAPTFASISPDAGSGAAQTFTVQFADPNGSSDIASLIFLLNTAINGNNACFFTYSRPSNSFYFFQDSTNSWLPLVAGSSASVSNANCTLSGTGAVVTTNGNSLTIVLPLSFHSPFSGTRNFYVSATDVGGLSTNWVTAGSWNPSAISYTPTVASLSPNSGSGLTQVFTLTLADQNGSSDIAGANIIINGSINGNNSCFFSFSRSGNAIYLFRDSDSSWQPLSPGQSGSVSNANCAIAGTGFSITPSGNNLTLALPLTFNSTFTGTKNIYVAVADLSNRSSGWITAGVWSPVVSTAPPTVTSLSPNAGSGASQTFTLTLADANGNTDIAGVNIIVNGAINGNNACFLSFSRSANAIYLFRDSDNTWQPLSPGQSGSVSNADCAIAGAGFSVTATGNNLTLALPLTFQPAFAGSKNFYVSVADISGLSSGWVLAGSWNPSGTPSAPTVTSVSPNNGAGTSRTFTFSLADQNGTADVAGLIVVINNYIDGNNACYFSYSRATNTLALFRDSDSAWLSVAAGSASTVTGKNCSISGAGLSASPAVNALTITVPITFLNGFAGTRNIYAMATDFTSLSSGWINVGSWTVN